MRVTITCDPPLLTEVVSLALSRIAGIELTGPDERPGEVLVASSSTDWQSRRSPRTILLDEASTLPALVQTLTAWVSQRDSGDYTLLQTSSKPHNSHASMNRSAGKAKPSSAKSPEIILFPVIDGIKDVRGTGMGRTGD